MRRLVDPAAWLPDEIGTTGYRASDTVLPAARWPELAGVTGLNSATRALVARIEEDGAVTLDALGEVLTRRFDVPRMTALSDVAGFVQQAQGMGALTFRSSMWSTVVVRVRPFVHFLSQPFDTTYWFTAPRRRYYPASAVGVIRHAAWSQFMIGVVVAIAFGGVVLPFVLGAAPWTDIGGSRAITTTFIVALLAGFPILGVLHEVAHYVVARRRAQQARQLYVEGLRIGLQYRSARRTDTLAITTAGPLGAIAGGITAIWLIATYGGGMWPGVPTRAAGAAIGLVCVYHLMCLFPPSADGSTLWALIRPSARRTDAPAATTPGRTKQTVS